MMIGIPIGMFDDGIQLVGAYSVMHGRLPYVDFFTMYGPLNYFLNAGMFQLFGPTNLSTKLLIALHYLATLLVIHDSVRRLSIETGTRLITEVALAFTVAIIVFLPSANSYLCGFSGLMLLCSPNGRRHANGIAGISGLLIGVAGAHRINFGAYFALAGTVAILLWPNQTLRSRLTVLAIMGLGVVFPILILGALFRGYIGLAVDHMLMLRPLMHERFLTESAMLGRTGILRLTTLQIPFLIVLHQSIFRIEKIPYHIRLIYLSWILIWLLIAILWVNDWTGLPVLALPLIFISLLLVFLVHSLVPCAAGLVCFAAFSHYFISRGDSYHFVPLLPLLVLCATGSWGALGGQKNLLRAIACIILPSLILVWSVLIFREQTRYFNLNLALSILRDPTNTGEYNAAKRYGGPHLKAEIEAIEEFRRLSGYDPLYIGLTNHARPFLNSIRGWWLAAQLPATHFYEFEPGLTSTARVQQEIIRDLEISCPRALILLRNEVIKPEPEYARRDLNGSRLLDAFIDRHYKVHSDNRFYEVRTLAAPCSLGAKSIRK